MSTLGSTLRYFCFVKDGVRKLHAEGTAHKHRSCCQKYKGLGEGEGFVPICDPGKDKELPGLSFLAKSVNRRSLPQLTDEGDCAR